MADMKWKVGYGAKDDVAPAIEEQTLDSGDFIITSDTEEMGFVKPDGTAMYIKSRPEIFISLSAAQEYIGSGAGTVYAGQIIVAKLEDEKYHTYTVQPSDGGYVLEEIGNTSNLKQYVITYSKAIYKDGKIIGVLGVDIPSEDLQNLVAKTPGNTFLFDQKNKIFAATNKELLNPSKGETHHEFHINWEFGGVKCKSLLDSINFDIENKICTIVDLKTTVHIGCFEESMKEYDYLRQLCFYWMAARWYLLNELDENPTLWEYTFYIVAIDTVGDNEIRVFKITEEQLFTRCSVITNTLDEIYWHQTTGNWEHHKEYYDGDGSETLEL